jgi:cell division septal protein FtsQ
VTTVAAPADRRFRRSHVKPSRARRRWNRALPLLKYLPAALLVGYGAHVGWKSVAQAHVLGVERIVVLGTERLSEADVLEALRGVRGESLVRIDLERWRQQLLATPWVKEASLRRSLPSTLEVVIRERRPIGIGRLKNGLYLVDEGGTIIDIWTPQHADLDLPIIDGLGMATGAGAPAADAPRAELAARVIGALKSNQELARRLSQVDVSDLHNARVILSDDPAVIWLGSDRFLERLQAYLELAPALRERVETIDHVDVRFENRIYVRPGVQRQARDKGTRP